MSPLFGRKPEPIHDPERPPPTRPAQVFETLKRHDVEYLTIGGVAVQMHGHERTTGDVDIVVRRSPENLAKLGRALEEMRAEIGGIDGHLVGVNPADPQQLYDGENFTLNTDAGPLDIWTNTESLPGSRPWEALADRGLSAHAHGTTIRVVGHDDLISLKRAAAEMPNRNPEKAATDRRDIDVLTARREDVERAARELRSRKGPPPPERGIER